MRERWQRARRSRCLARDGLTVVAESEAARTRFPCVISLRPGSPWGRMATPSPDTAPRVPRCVAAYGKTFLVSSPLVLKKAKNMRW